MHCQTPVSLFSNSQQQLKSTERGIPTVEKLPKAFAMEYEEYGSQDQYTQHTITRSPEKEIDNKG
jgi:hypothetical protein